MIHVFSNGLLISVFSNGLLILTLILINTSTIIVTADTDIDENLRSSDRLMTQRTSIMVIMPSVVK